MIGDKPFFTSLEDYNGGTITLGDGSLARVKGKRSIFFLDYPKLDGVPYVDRLKANLLSISQICDNQHRVNFSQNKCQVINKDGKVIITRHRTVDN